MADAGTDLGAVESLLQKAISLDDSLAEAHVQLGNSMPTSTSTRSRFPNMCGPWRSIQNLSDAHYRLGTDYVHVGEKENAQKEFAIYQKLRAEHLAEVEKERAEVQQFVYSEKAHGDQQTVVA